MKKVLFSFIFIGMLTQLAPLHAVSAARAIKCSLSRFHKKFNCTQEEITAGKKWLIGASITAALATLAAVIGSVKLAEVKAEKERIRMAEERATKEAIEQPAEESSVLPTEEQKRAQSEAAWNSDMTALMHNITIAEKQKLTLSKATAGEKRQFEWSVQKISEQIANLLISLFTKAEMFDKGFKGIFVPSGNDQEQLFNTIEESRHLINFDTLIQQFANEYQRLNKPFDITLYNKQIRNLLHLKTISATERSLFR